jgi:sortase (surface protein transpeptidase)
VFLFSGYSQLILQLQLTKTKQNKTKQSKAKQSKAKQSKAKQNKTKQNKTKQKQPESSKLCQVNKMTLRVIGFLCCTSEVLQVSPSCLLV